MKRAEKIVRRGKPNYEVYLHLRLDKIKKIIDKWLTNPFAKICKRKNYDVISYKLTTLYLYESTTGLEIVSVKKSITNEIYDI